MAVVHYMGDKSHEESSLSTPRGSSWRCSDFAVKATGNKEAAAWRLSGRGAFLQIVEAFILGLKADFWSRNGAEDALKGVEGLEDVETSVQLHWSERMEGMELFALEGAPRAWS